MFTNEQMFSIIAKMEKAKNKMEENSLSVTPYLLDKLKLGEVDDSFNANLDYAKKCADKADGMNEAIKVLRTELLSIVWENEKNDK